MSISLMLILALGLIVTPAFFILTATTGHRYNYYKMFPASIPGVEEKARRQLKRGIFYGVVCAVSLVVFLITIQPYLH